MSATSCELVTRDRIAMAKKCYRDAKGS